ncbi:hypothetical protein MNBD_GAMMA09-1204 [hydrothermal vent metagenome]|uniref:General secretion pathway GspH domain-containing protein n=1 Tax=hydrothermal vent metagenome TaxID=652676 RepID=A0A3B0Y9K3_9ZZZZ
MKKKKQSGFTLLELMVVLGMSGALIAIGVPSFNAMITTNQLADITNKLTLSLKQARAEAIASGRDVVVCSSTTTDSSSEGVAKCSGSAGNWNKGWLILVDRNQDGSFLESQGELISVSTIDSGTTVSITPGPFVPLGLTNDFSQFVQFSYTGELKAGVAGGFQICSGVSGDGYSRRDITVSVSGQTNFEKNTASANDC